MTVQRMCLCLCRDTLFTICSMLRRALKRLLRLRSALYATLCSAIRTCVRGHSRVCVHLCHVTVLLLACVRWCFIPHSRSNRLTTSHSSHVGQLSRDVTAWVIALCLHSLENGFPTIWLMRQAWGNRPASLPSPDRARHHLSLPAPPPRIRPPGGYTS